MLHFAALPMLFVAAGQPAPITGLWKNPIGSAIIAVRPCGQPLCGTIVWASERGRREVAANTSHVVGTVVLTDVKPSGSGWAGRLFIPDDNIHVGARIERLSAGKLKLTGCAVIGLICRSQVWTRVGAVPAAD